VKRPRTVCSVVTRQLLAIGVDPLFHTSPISQKYTRVPQELQYSNSDILLAADDPGREQQQQLLQRVAADEADERDWRARSTLPPAPASAQQQQQQQQPPQQPQPGWRPDQQPSSSAAAPTPAAGGPEVAKVQRATDIGRTAWHAGEATEGADQTLRKVKGILNKLTPEKFERLLSQLIPMVSGYEVLQVRPHYSSTGQCRRRACNGAGSTGVGLAAALQWRCMLKCSPDDTEQSPTLAHL
jgi:hypothetical protein